MRAFETFTAATKETPGWFYHQAAAAWDCLLDYQESNGVQGDFLEIGVWKGKSASLAAMHCRSEERCVFVDFGDLTDAKANLERAAPTANTSFVRESSSAFSWNPLVGEIAGRVRWMHIDGGHSGADVTHDLELANRVVSDRGIACLDDFFSPGYPQVTQAAFRFLENHPGQFALVLLGFNKGFLARPAAAGEYRAFIKDSLHAAMAARGCGDVTLWKTNTPEECNSFGMTGDSGTPYRGLDEDHSEIVI